MIASPAMVPAAVRDLVDTEVAAAAKRVDEDGVHPAAVLACLGQEGAFRSHVEDGKPPALDVAIATTAAISEACLTTGFCTWCQHSAGWLVANSDNAGLRAGLLPGIANGAVPAGVGLANPVKAMRGTEQFKLRAERVRGGYLVSGAQPWISNMGEGHWFATVFADLADPSHRITAMVRCGQSGVTIRPNVHMTSLRGSATVTVLFKQAFVPAEHILADPAESLLSRAYPGIVLLQTGMALGVIGAGIALMREFDAGQFESNRHLPRHPDDFAADRDALQERIVRLTETPLDDSPGYLRSVFETRLQASELTLAATRMAMLRAGLPAFMQGSPVDRRMREGNFVATITPSMRFLLRALATSPETPWPI
ncbi:acyl-CoA dehydrogenase family protein [Amycolatopsis sp. Hca4]|uniref:acyl-CoA dehydrogenase family protein n=1 Tax=Amycolatopsis sp. Hca4 TaxID=2742131 RepID=UPI00158FC7C6|nr:acyl-CoA dehydrogenase family protein [Amycolatopsis sp. Hca4]QKV74063.1 acyl-CoA/acyl-ACP dehydrogenase [Amycolatopsis sp. Hca4]